MQTKAYTLHWEVVRQIESQFMWNIYWIYLQNIRINQELNQQYIHWLIPKSTIIFYSNTLFSCCTLSWRCLINKMINSLNSWEEETNITLWTNVTKQESAKIEFDCCHFSHLAISSTTFPELRQTDLVVEKKGITFFSRLGTESQL